MCHLKNTHNRFFFFQSRKSTCVPHSFQGPLYVKLFTPLYFINVTCCFVCVFLRACSCVCVCVCAPLTTVLKSSFCGRMLLQDRQSAWQSLCPWSHRQNSSRATTVFMAGPTICCTTQNNADTRVQRNSSKDLPVSMRAVVSH